MATSQRDLLLHCCECLIFVLPTIMGHQKDFAYNIRGSASVRPPNPK